MTITLHRRCICGAAAARSTRFAEVRRDVGYPDGLGQDMVSNPVGRGQGRLRGEPASAQNRPQNTPLAGAARRSSAPPDSTEELLRRYRQRGTSALRAALRDRVVERHRGIVESIAFQFATRLPPSVDAQDLVHAGMWGLMQAIDSYQPDRCDQFQAFMRIRVRGAMLDELRHMDFLPRLFRRRLRERDAVRARLCMELEREPTESELAAALGITQVALLRRCEPAVWRSERGGDGESDEDQVEQLADDASESPIEVITRQELMELIRVSLEPVEWKVLKLHYLEGLTGKQVAQKLRLSASRICQIHGRVLDRLKAQLTTALV